MDEKTVNAIAGSAAEAAAVTANFTGAALVMLVRHLEKAVQLSRGTMETAIRDFIKDWQSDPQRPDYGAFFVPLLQSFELNRDWPNVKKFRLH